MPVFLFISYLVCLQVAQHLTSTYGGKAFDVAKIAQVTGQRWPIVGKRLVSEFPYIEAEVKLDFMHVTNSLKAQLAQVKPYVCFLSQVLYAIKEYACTAIDVIARRTRLGFLNVQAADEALPRIVQIMGKELDWSQERRTVRFEQLICQKMIDTHKDFVKSHPFMSVDCVISFVAPEKSALLCVLL